MSDVISGLSGGVAGAATGAKLGTLFGPGGTVVGGIAGGALGALAGILGKPDKSPQEKALEKLIQDLDAQGVPPTEALQVAYDKLGQAGKLTPEIETAIKQGSTELSKIQTDPAYKSAQREALTRLKSEGDSGGMMLEDRAAIDKALSASGQQARGREGAILQNMAQRGTLGSGEELAARLSASQNAANQAQATGINVAADARRRALEAVLQGGQLAGTLQNQEFGQQKDVASAQDAINRFNSSNLQDVAQRNIANNMNASKFNIGNTLDVNKYNTTAQQNQANTNAKAVQQAYQNKANQFDTRASLLTGQANAQAASKAQQGNTMGNAFKLVGDVVDKGTDIYNKAKDASDNSKEDDLEKEYAGS